MRDNKKHFQATVMMGLAVEPIFKCYEAGFDCGVNGANDENCHYSYFLTPERAERWEKGKRDGEKAK